MKQSILGFVVLHVHSGSARLALPTLPYGFWVYKTLESDSPRVFFFWWLTTA